MFRPRVCVKHSSSRCCNFDLHNFTGIFLGYTATNQNIVYLDTTNSIVKSCHHAVFDKVWYLQLTRPPAAQLLHNLCLQAKTDFIFLDGPLHPTPIGTISLVLVTWPPAQSEPTKSKHWLPPPASLYALLPLWMTAEPTIISARVACTQVPRSKLSNHALTLATVMEYLIGPHNMEMIYLSSDPYGQTFDEQLDLRKCDLTLHRTAGLRFIVKDGHLILASMDKGTPGECMDTWRTPICRAWLISINGLNVSTVTDAQVVFAGLSTANATTHLLASCHLARHLASQPAHYLTWGVFPVYPQPTQ